MDLISAQDFAFELGITTTGEMFVPPEMLDSLQSLADSDQLRLRTSLYLLYTDNCGVIQEDWYRSQPPLRPPGQHLRIGGVKIFSDGGSCMAPAVTFDYPGGIGRGDLFLDQETMNEVVSQVANDGYQLAIHSAGDRSLDVVLNAIEKALDGRPNLLRHRIEHNSVVRPDQIERYSQIGVVPTIFAPFPTCTKLGGETYFKYIVPEDYKTWEWPWRELLDANPSLVFAWHSDWPVFGTLDPFDHLWSFVTRKQVAPDGSICEPPEWLAANVISVEEALRMMTYGSAYALNWESEVGTLTTGKSADLIIISQNPLGIPLDEILEIEIRMTMTRGEVVFCAETYESLCWEG